MGCRCTMPSHVLCLALTQPVPTVFYSLGCPVNERTNGELIAIDGKLLRSSYNRGDRQSTIHMVRAFVSTTGVVTGPVETRSQVERNHRHSVVTHATGYQRMPGIHRCHGLSDRHCQHHRQARWRLSVGDDVASQLPEWKRLKTLGVIIDYRLEKSGRQSLYCRLYIILTELDKVHFVAAVRGHWRTENSLHWVLDVLMNE